MLRVTRGAVVLINAAAGGVGHIAVQIASGLGVAAVLAYDATDDVAKAT